MSSPSLHPANEDLRVRLERIAELLEAQHATSFRVAAYRRAARTVADSPNPLSDVFAATGVEGLQRLPGIGRSIASLIREYVRSGHITLLERLAGSVSTEELLASVPGLGPRLAHRVHEDLGIETLEDLECACHDGRLGAVRGFGPRRLEAIAASLAVRLGGSAGRTPPARQRPPIPALLEVDAEYRRRAAAGELPRIAPRRFNPENRAWLPVLHTASAGWDMTALFSNTARAHRLAKTDDWVVIYAERNGDHDQCTVVSEGRRQPRRVVRGREHEVVEREAG